MYAIFEDGSHQFRVQEGDRLTLDRRDGVAGDLVEFDKVFLIAGRDGEPLLGAPTVPGAKVTARIERQFRGKKIIIQKFRRRKNVRRRRGHRQYHTAVKIESVVVPV